MVVRWLIALVAAAVFLVDIVPVQAASELPPAPPDAETVGSFLTTCADPDAGHRTSCDFAIDYAVYTAEVNPPGKLGFCPPKDVAEAEHRVFAGKYSPQFPDLYKNVTAWLREHSSEHAKDLLNDGLFLALGAIYPCK